MEHQFFNPDYNAPVLAAKMFTNRTTHIRHQCRKTTVLSCRICLINTGVEKTDNI
jgi:hypothetical protein